MLNSEKRRPRASKKRAALTAGAVAGFAALAAVPAFASPPVGGQPIEAGENITAVHNIDFIAAFGVGNLGDVARIDVLRGGIAIGTAQGPLVDTPEGPGLEANHGPAGAPEPGDCWDTWTPNVRPDDLVRVTNTVTGDVDEALVDEITFDDAAVVGDEAHYTGVARYSDGTPIPADVLNSGFWRTDVGGIDSRGEGPLVEVDPVTGAYIARWQPPNYGTFVGNVPAPADIENADRQEFGYGHVAPLPPETQLHDGIGEAPGPALGCEGSPAAPANAITVVSDPVVNLTSGELSVSGVSDPAATTVGVSIDDADAGTPAVSATTVSNPAGANPGDQQAWSASFADGSLDGLADGTLTITAVFDAGADATRDIQKDTTPPPPPPPVDPGNGGGNGGGAGGGAGAGAGGGAIGGGAGGPGIAPDVARFVQVSSLRTRSRVRLRSARRSGIRVSFVAPEGANVVRVQLFRGSRAAQADQPVGQRTVQLSRTGRHAVRINARSVRRALRRGVYRIVISAGQSEDSLNQAVGKRIRIVR